MLESGYKHKRRSEERGVFTEERLLNCFLRTCHVGSGREEAREEISGMAAWQVSETKQKHSRRENSVFEGCVWQLVRSQTVFRTYFTDILQRELQKGCLSPLTVIIITILCTASVLNPSHYILFHTFTTFYFHHFETLPHFLLLS